MLNQAPTSLGENIINVQLSQNTVGNTLVRRADIILYLSYMKVVKASTPSYDEPLIQINFHDPIQILKTDMFEQ